MDGRVFWITGLSGAGKTTVGKILYERLKKCRDNIVFLDGDILREIFGNDLGYTFEERHKSALRNAKICRLLSAQGIHVVCCTISMFKDVRKWNRDQNTNYTEIYLKVPIEVLHQRNQKNLYAACAQDLVGIGVGMEEPEHPDIEIINDGRFTPDDIVDIIFEKVDIDL